MIPPNNKWVGPTRIKPKIHPYLTIYAPALVEREGTKLYRLIVSRWPTHPCEAGHAYQAVFHVDISGKIPYVQLQIR